MKAKFNFFRTACLVILLLAGQLLDTEGQIIGEIQYMTTHDTDIGSGQSTENNGVWWQIRMSSPYSVDNQSDYDAYLKFNVKDSVVIPEGMKVLSAKIKVKTTANEGAALPDFVVLHVEDDSWNEDASIPVEQAPDVGVVYTDTLDRTSFTGGNGTFLSLDVTDALLAELAAEDEFMSIRIDNLSEGYYAAGARDMIYWTDPSNWKFGWDPPRLHVSYGYEPDSIFSDVEDFGNTNNYLTRTNSSLDKRLWYNEVGIWVVAEDEGDSRLYITERGAPYKPTADHDPSPGGYAVYEGETYADFDISMKAKINAMDDGLVKSKTDFIIVFGFTDPDNYSYMQFQVGNEGAFYQVTNASKSMVGTANETAAISDTAYHAYRLVRTGSSVSAYIDDVEYLTVDDAALVTAGKIGMGSYNDHAFFDDFEEGSGGEPIGIEEMTESQLNLYPNPFNTSLSIRSETEIRSIDIQNIVGQTVKSFLNIQSNEIELNTSELKSGVYFIRIYDSEGFSGIRKIVKR